MNHRFRFSTSGNSTKHMPIAYLSLWVQPRSLTSGDLSWHWNWSGAMSRVISSHVLTSISSTIPIHVNRTTPICVYLLTISLKSCRRLKSYDVIPSWPDPTWPLFFYQKLHKRCSISYGNFQHDSPNGVPSSLEKLMWLHQPPWPGEGWQKYIFGHFENPMFKSMDYDMAIRTVYNLSSLCLLF